MFYPQNTSESQLFKTILAYSLVIIILPIALFFFSKIIIFNAIFGMSHVSSEVSGAVVAIVAVHGAVGAFIYRTFYEGQTKLAPKID